MTQAFDKPWPGVETAGSAALSFVNTMDWRLRSAPVELLNNYEDLVRWGRTAGAVTTAEARTLKAQGEAHPRSAAQVLREAIALREAMAAIWEAVASGRALPSEALAILNGVSARARSAQALKEAEVGAAWRWWNTEPELARPLWAAALAAGELLTAPEIVRVRQCGDAECGWFFLDTSKNRSRRWCSMESCGNRNKARRFYRRAKEAR